MKNAYNILKKKNKYFHVCVDYYGFNKVIVKNHYPSPLIFLFFEKLGQSKILTKVDLKGAYNLICIKEDNECKTMFHIRYDHFEYNVMPFGLTNPLSIFQT
jgi:hypothetical protein